MFFSWFPTMRPSFGEGSVAHSQAMELQKRVDARMQALGLGTGTRTMTESEKEQIEIAELEAKQINGEELQNHELWLLATREEDRRQRQEQGKADISELAKLLEEDERLVYDSRRAEKIATLRNRIKARVQEEKCNQPGLTEIEYQDLKHQLQNLGGSISQQELQKRTLQEEQVQKARDKVMEAIIQQEKQKVDDTATYAQKMAHWSAQEAKRQAAEQKMSEEAKKQQEQKQQLDLYRAKLAEEEKKKTEEWKKRLQQEFKERMEAEKARIEAEERKRIEAAILAEEEAALEEQKAAAAE